MSNLLIHMAMVHRCSPAWRWDSATMRWQGVLFWLVVGGRGRLHAPYGRFVLGRGDSFILPLADRYLGVHSVDEPLVVLSVHFSGLDRQLPFHQQCQRLDLLEGLHERLRTSLEQYGDEPQRSHGWFEALLLEREHQARSLAERSCYSSTIEEICERIRQNPRVRIEVATMAEELGISPDHFIRLFRDQVGVTPDAYRIQLRIEAAKGLLRWSSQSIESIADELGFSDRFHFSRQFKQLAGVPPGAWRKGGRKEE